ncbi:MAG: hypothetical protein LBS36_02200 [Oscillospiraceae bacterium]|nr:hypothetical protein [Oscillospiraceae bacterium]
MNAKKLFSVIFFSLLLLCALSVPAAADMGPKPGLTVKVKNAPDELYYLDLLVKSESRYENLGEERVNYDQAMLAVLDQYHDDGWRPALTAGTSTPLFGKLTGSEQNGQMVHRFSYYGVPAEYRVILVTQSGTIRVTDPLERKTFQSTVVYDYATGETVTPAVPPAYLVQFLVTCIPTLLIEGLVLLLFRYRLKKNFKVFLLTNVATQVALTALLGSVLIFGGSFGGKLLLLPIEACITLAEALIYKNKLKGYSARRAVAYAVCANAASLLAGWFLIDPLYALLGQIL